MIKGLQNVSFHIIDRISPPTPTSALDSRISPRAFGPRTPYLKLLQHMTLN